VPLEHGGWRLAAEPGRQPLLVQEELRHDLSVHLHDGDALQIVAQQLVIRIDVDLLELEVEAVRSELEQPVSSLVAEVAVRPPVKPD
jgi:hypothetical protein